MENHDQNAMQGPNPVWAFQILATMHFIRFFMMLSYLAISLPSISSEIYPLFVIAWIFQLFMEMLGGFLFLSRKFSIRYLAIFYLAIGTIVPYSIYRTVLFFLAFLLLIPSLSIILAFIFDFIMGASNVIEIIVLLFLGINWIRKEYLHTNSK